MPPLTDPSAIRALLESDRPWAVYPLGDLSPAHFPHCSWFHVPGPKPALALLYRAFTPPVLFALGPPQALHSLLAEIAAEPELYLHVRPDLLPVLDVRYHVAEPRFMWRMLLSPAESLPWTADAVRLGPGDLDALRALYADGQARGEAPEFFSPAMLAEGVYFGVREGGDLVAAAGTHLVVPGEGVAAIGNVYTRRDRRGRGLGSGVTGAVAAELVRRGLRTVALNVSQDNTAAIRVYERLGFARYCDFTEGLAVRRG
jgi:ribosomal protein S18 acetylase RimI-like enzyme